MSQAENTILWQAWKDGNLTRISSHFVEYPPKSEKKLFHVPAGSPNQVCE